MKDKPNISLTEIFMAKKGRKGWDTCFYGTITRGKDIVHSRIEINDGYIIANGKDQWEVGEKLDELVIANLMSKLCDDVNPILN